MAIDKGKREMTEEELDEMVSSGRWTPVDIPPINPNSPGGPMTPPPPHYGREQFGSGPLPPNFGLPGALANSGYGANTGPIGLMPIYQSPTIGSAISSHTQPIAETANAASETANSAQTSATVAKTGVTTINAKTAVGIVSGVLQQVPISTLGTAAATPSQDNLNDGTTFGRVLNTALTANQVDTTKPGFLANIGSFPSTVVGTTASIISYTSTTTSVSFSWSSFMILFSDGTTETVASGSQVVTGLSASQTYYAYPVVVGTALTLTFIAVSGGVGSPAILYQPQNPQAAQQQNLQSNTAMSAGGIACVTPSSGSGGGHGGGSGICLRAGQYIESESRGIVAIEDVEVGELIRGRREWTEVVGKKVLPQNHFVRVTASSGEQVSFTPTHWTTAIRDGEETTIPAGKLTVSDFLILREGYASITSIEHLDGESYKVQLSCEPEHEFFCSASRAASILVHNVQPISAWILTALTFFLFAHHIA